MKFVLALIFSLPAVAQGAPHHFWDSKNVVGLAAHAFTAGLNIDSTIRAEKIPNMRELDPLARTKPGVICSEVAVIGAGVAISAWEHRHGHHTLERWVYPPAAGAQLAASIHNFEVARRRPMLQSRGSRF